MKEPCIYSEGRHGERPRQCKPFAAMRWNRPMNAASSTAIIFVRKSQAGSLAAEAPHTASAAADNFPDWRSRDGMPMKLHIRTLASNCGRKYSILLVVRTNRSRPPREPPLGILQSYKGKSFSRGRTQHENRQRLPCHKISAKEDFKMISAYSIPKKSSKANFLSLKASSNSPWKQFRH
jgi:hypothetical protein